MTGRMKIILMCVIYIAVFVELIVSLVAINISEDLLQNEAFAKVVKYLYLLKMYI